MVVWWGQLRKFPLHKTLQHGGILSVEPALQDHVWEGGWGAVAAAAAKPAPVHDQISHPQPPPCPVSLPHPMQLSPTPPATPSKFQEMW